MLMVITQSSRVGHQADDVDFCTNRHVAHPRVANLHAIALLRIGKECISRLPERPLLLATSSDE
jgi:hypothetical protein